MNTVVNYEQLCTDWLSSWTGNRPEKLLSFYTPDAFYLDPANPSGLHGQDEMKPYFEKLLVKNPNWEWKAEEIMATEKGFTLKWKALIPVHEQTLTIHGLDIVELHGHLICRNEVYFDRTPWLQAVRK